MTYFRIILTLALIVISGCSVASESSEKIENLVGLLSDFEGVDVDFYKKEYFLSDKDNSYIGGLYCSYHKCMDFQAYGKGKKTALPILSAAIFIYGYLENRSQLSEMSEDKREEYINALHEVSGCDNQQLIPCLKKSFRERVIDNGLRVDSVIFDNGTYSHQMLNDDLFKVVEEF